MIDPELLELLESSITIEGIAARALDGGRTYDSPTTYRAHVEVRTDMVRNASGEEVMSAGRCHLDGHYPLIVESNRVTLPGGAQWAIIAVAHTFDSAGPYQTVVFW